VHAVDVADDEPTEGLYALTEGTAVRLEIVSVDEGASLKLGGAKLDHAGASTEVGKAPALHAHTFWQIEAADDAIGERRIVFRLKAATGDYEPSASYEVRASNDKPVATTTTLATTTTTSAGPACGNGVVDPDEACDAGPDPWSAGRACDDGCGWLACGDSNADGGVSASDALRTLRYAIELDTSPLPCPAYSE